MSDLDLEIRVSNQSANAALASTTQEAKKTEGAFANLAKGVKDAFAPGKFDEMHKLGSGLKEMAKGQAMQAIRSGLGSIAGELAKVSGIDVSGTGTSLGYMFGGPLGAAIGTAIEALGNYGESIDSMTERWRRMHETTEETFARLTKGADTFEEQLHALVAAGLDTADAVRLMTEHLGRLHSVMSLFAGTQGIVAQARKDIDRFNLVMDLSGASAAKKYHEQIDQVNQFMKDFPALAHLGERAIKGLSGGFKEATQSARTFHKAAVNQVTDAQFLPGEGFEPDAISGGRLNSGLFPNGIPALPQYQDLDIDRATRIHEFANAPMESGQKLAEILRENEAEAQALNEALGTTADILKGPILQSSQQLVSNLVDAAHGADMAWADFGENLLKMFEKAILQALVLKALTGTVTGAAGADGNAVGGLFKILGFASGGMIMPSAGGGTDSQVVMFRKSPEETVRIHTPQQEQAFARGGVGGNVTIVNQPVDDRALLAALSGPAGTRVIHNLVRQNPGAFKSLLG